MDKYYHNNIFFLPRIVNHFRDSQSSISKIAKFQVLQPAGG